MTTFTSKNTMTMLDAIADLSFGGILSRKEAGRMSAKVLGLAEVHAILRNAGHPMRAGDIMDEMEELVTIQRVNALLKALIASGEVVRKVVRTKCVVQVPVDGYIYATERTIKCVFYSAVEEEEEG